MAGTAPIVIAQQGVVGDCYDCHTMHNSENGLPVAQTGNGSTVTTSATPIANLLKMDCIACHAQDPDGGTKTWTLPGGSVIPQVMHADATGDLAAGNFRYIAESGQSKGHNVVDVVPADTVLLDPPGYRHEDGVLFDFDVEKFTCAGSMGCHGIRNQALENGTSCDPFDPFCVPTETVMRTGLYALSGWDGPGGASGYTFFRGAHHQNYDGLKLDGYNPDFYQSPLAHSYRFIRSLRGYGNETDRWQNVDENSHNEYIGGWNNDYYKNEDYSSTTVCVNCHQNNTQGGDTSRIIIPNQTMTGFCITCHARFHSTGSTNGTSGAFLRHPSDYVIPDSGEYQYYTTYDVTAPVARPISTFVAGMSSSPDVNPGQDMVMCLSCHMAHASPYDNMLRFDYSVMTAGAYGDETAAEAAGGCLACHTAKGVLPQNRTR